MARDLFCVWCNRSHNVHGSREQFGIGFCHLGQIAPQRHDIVMQQPPRSRGVTAGNEPVRVMPSSSWRMTVFVEKQEGVGGSSGGLNDRWECRICKAI